MTKKKLVEWPMTDNRFVPKVPYFSVEDPRGAWGARNLSQNLSQIAGNGHFRDSNFQTFLGGMPPDAP